MRTLILVVIAGGLVFGAVPAESQPRIQSRVQLHATDAGGIGSASISPDGRWLAFSLNENEAESSLWIRPVEGGEAARLTGPGKWDAAVQWSPKGDRLFFLSTRPARSGSGLSYVMTVPVDPGTGRAIAPPRQVTLDPVSSSRFRVSPDGASIAYQQDPGGRVLRVVPSNGGTARTLAEVNFPPLAIGWSADARHVIFDRRTTRAGERSIVRIPAEGGAEVELGRTGRAIRQPGPDARYFVVTRNGEGQRERFFDIVSIRDEVLATIPGSTDMQPAGFTPDGRSLLVRKSDVIAQTRITPIGGGRYREVTQPAGYDWIAGWSADSKTVYTLTEQGGNVLALVPLEGGRTRTIPVVNEPAPEGLHYFGANAGVLAFWERGDSAGLDRLTALHVPSNSRRLISERLVRLPDVTIYGPGGVMQMYGEEILYLERTRDRIEVRASMVDGRSRLIRSFPVSLQGQTAFAVHGNRIAWTQPNDAEGVDLMIADGPEAEPRRLLSAGSLSNELAFSLDGRWIATHYRAAGEPRAEDPLALVDTRRFEQNRPSRLIDTGALYWYWPRWLPDASGVLVLAGTGPASNTHVVMVPLREGEPPVAITRDDPSPKWGFELSPDGQYIAYPGEIWRGSSLWRVDLNGAIPR